MNRVKKGWNGPRIVFSFLQCPDCKQDIQAPHCPIMDAELQSAYKYRAEVVKKALERSKHEGIDKDARLKDPTDAYYGDLEKYAMYKLAYY